jgi:hypothetical protein
MRGCAAWFQTMPSDPPGCGAHSHILRTRPQHGRSHGPSPVARKRGIAPEDKGTQLKPLPSRPLRMAVCTSQLLLATVVAGGAKINIKIH